MSISPNSKVDKDEFSQALRDQYKLRTINPVAGTLKDELDSGKFTIVVSEGLPWSLFLL